MSTAGETGVSTSNKRLGYPFPSRGFKVKQKVVKGAVENLIQ
jgi:hypothetical protein